MRALRLSLNNVLALDVGKSQKRGTAREGIKTLSRVDQRHRLVVSQKRGTAREGIKTSGDALRPTAALHKKSEKRYCS